MHSTTKSWSCHVTVGRLDCNLVVSKHLNTAEECTAFKLEERTHYGMAFVLKHSEKSLFWYSGYCQFKCTLLAQDS